MKYLDYPVLSQLSHVLSSNPSPEARVNARVEAYSIKQGAKDRKMYKEMEEQYVSGQEDMDEMSFSPEMKQAGLFSCFGRLDVKESRKVHYLLVSTLNSAFPGYDFSGLRPDHFMREISVSQVLSNLSTNLLGIDTVDLSPLAAANPAPSHPSPTIGPTHVAGTSPPTAEVGNPSLYRLLDDVLPLSECEVYSWFPEPEYDPHVEPEENEEASEFEDDSDDEPMDDDSMDIDIDGEGAYVSWGQAGMDLELEGVPSSNSAKPRSSSFSGLSTQDYSDLIMSSPRLGPIGEDGEWSPPRKVGGLLWSANYFFYCRPKKRVLFITTWSRKRPSHDGESTLYAEADSLPLPISSSFTPPSSSLPAFTALPTSKARQARGHHNLSNARPNHRRAKAPAKLATGKSLSTATIPIRGLSHTPAPATPSRLAASAPSNLSPMTSPASMRITPGFKPRQTQARMLINAAAATRSASSGITTTKAAAVAAHSSSAAEGESSRVRKERSGSLTPGPMLGLVDAVVGSNVVSDAAKGKRVRV